MPNTSPALDSRAGDAGEIDNGYSADDAVDFVLPLLCRHALGGVERMVIGDAFKYPAGRDMRGAI